MGLFTFIKERLTYLVIGLIIIAILAFLLSDAVRSGTPFIRESQNQVGIIAGKKITYDEFNEKIKDKEDQFKAQYHQTSLPEQTRHFVMDQAWNDLVSTTILENEISKSGLGVEKNSEEYFDMLTGKDPDPQIKQAFTNPQTGIYDPSQLKGFIQNLEKDGTGERRKQWDKFENDLLKSHSIQKYLQLLKGGVYVTSLEINTGVNIPQKANIDYVSLDFSQIPDNKVNVTDDELKQYFNDHSYLYQIPEEERSFDYVVFQAKPSQEDTLAAQREISKLGEDFKASKEDSLFVSLNSNSKVPMNFYKKNQIAQISKKLDSSLNSLSVGNVLGPFFENGSYRLAKLVASRDLPDSVKSRHILLTDAVNGGPVQNYPALMKKADSLKSVILAGGNFANLAIQYSADKGSAVKGGELGYAPMGAFVKPFQDAVFYGKTGEYKIVQTQFGVHLIQIEDQKNIGKAYEIAFIERPFHPSSRTLEANYSKGTSFLSEINGQDFATIARKKGFQVRSAVDIKANDAQINSVDNSRKVIQWAFGTQKGTNSEVFDLGESALVARLSDIKPKGISNFESVKLQVQASALKDKKGTVLAGQLKEAAKSSHSIQELASKLQLSPISADSLSFSSPLVGRNIIEPNLVGAAFGANQGVLSKPVIGEKAVYIFQLKNKFPVNMGVDPKTMKRNAINSRGTIAQNDALEALKKLANIVDNRSKFF